MQIKSLPLVSTFPLKTILRALQHRNYRLFFIGQFISLLGTWVQQIALSWFVYRLTNSPFMLGFFGFSSQIPIFFLTPFAGVLIDRLSCHRIIITTQIISMIQAFLITLFAWQGGSHLLHLILLNLLLGIVNAIDMPARQSFVLEMIENREDLGNAIALNSMIINGTRLIGPSVAGILIAVWGETICFLLNAISFLAVLWALFSMKLNPTPPKRADSRIWQDFKEGFAYVFGFPPLRSIIILLAFMSLMGIPYQQLMPVMAKDVLHGGPHTLGFLMGITGLGAFLSAIYLASRSKLSGTGRLIVIGCLIFGSGLVLLSFVKTSFPALLIMLFIGIGMMMGIASINTSLQTITEDKMRGRVMSYYVLAFMGMTPFGSLLAGIMANRIGVSKTFLLCGLACILGSLVFALKIKELRAMIRARAAEKKSEAS